MLCGWPPTFAHLVVIYRATMFLSVVTSMGHSDIVTDFHISRMAPSAYLRLKGLAHIRNVFMSLKTAFAAVLKAMRAGKGLTQRNLAEVSSRTYVSKLERGQSSPTLEMIMALSGPLSVNPLTLVAITLSAESGQSVDALLRRTQAELADLAQDGVLKNLTLSSDDELLPPRASVKSSNPPPPMKSQQVEFCFAD
ncbi:hypothetical protein PS947_03038 [Pseudomonas fluorescens]|nr:hypothetical protein PS947_03038 [Pseudomonas fluorescens]